MGLWLNILNATRNQGYILSERDTTVKLLGRGDIRSCWYLFIACQKRSVLITRPVLHNHQTQRRNVVFFLGPAFLG